ncbi:catalase [Lactobacillus sp. DCY120]|uniref:Catalase n=1 Tax=Bombilactobacillus apium TaxID=2675299 RepID=A0A850RCR6_9LACO|nr:catalase [Bombilactobacillus apium]NVY96558.1 catalase [Bombilactobacillus apium]
MTDKLTTSSGQAWGNNDHSQTAGVRGPVLMQDYQLLEKLAHFNRERIPERVVHAKGAGAKGIFTLTYDMSDYTTADLFCGQNKMTPVLARFSQVAGESGYPDTIRDVRGFALRFYTQAGNYDIVGNNTPVFFINDPLKFPDFIHSQKRDPQTHLRSDEMQWDFWAHYPEALHQVTYLMGDRGNPASYRTMNGYGSHTFKWVNAQGEQYWIKYHFLSNQGVQNMSAKIATKLASEDPDYLLHDLYDAIAQGDYPSWKVYVQIIPYEEGWDYKYDLFDVTKVVSHHDYPLVEVGEFTLNQNPTNYFTDIEEAAFSPANLVSGIEPSPDKVLQGRLFAYHDAARYRLGANYDQLAVNRPLNEVHNYERDGVMAQGQGKAVNYAPSGHDGPQADPSSQIHGNPLTGREGNYEPYDPDYYSAAGRLYRLMSKDEQDRLIEAIVGSLGSVSDAEIKLLATRQFYQADSDYGTRVAQALGLDLSQVKK